jgi:hypothetical protein
MNISILRRLIPALVVGAVLAFSALMPLTGVASSTNNCGVKGYGYHDHGKPCPNRPFPGHGIGVQRILAAQAGTSETVTATPTKDEEKKPANSTTITLTATSTDNDTTKKGKGHGRGKAHFRGRFS